MSRLFAWSLAAVTAAALAFLALPLVALFARVTPDRLFAQLADPVVRDALLVTAKTNAIAQALVLAVGTPAAYALARRFPGRSVLVTLVELPLVLPPAVAGIGLLAAFGRTGLLGLGVSFTQTAVVLAVAFVSSPFYVRAAIAAFEGVDPGIVDAARTLGAGPARVFVRVALPLAARGLAAGFALALARGIGEFGATLMFAGSLRGRTQTLSLAIYAEFARDFDVALALGALLVLCSLVLLLALKLRWTAFPSLWPLRSARSA
ncbi:MAG TPA: ABC transporter permease subunit [Gaiellaceae bacterium]|jgi:molybdate transport system permease protein|nr:ABC transporter permease subunit [Gaiellaceae bacterium]